MRADADFMVYVAARWPSLVREAVRLGVRPEDAADAATDALSRCRRDWGRTSHEEDVDALVREQLVRAAGRRPRIGEAGREKRAEELLVLAPPSLEDLKRQERANNRALLGRAAKVAVPLLLVGAAAGAYFAAYGDDEKPDGKPNDTIDNAAVLHEENPAPGVIWYADGQLHLAHSVLAVEGLTDMTRVGTGVVYGDDEGRVVYAANDGSREVLGHKDPDVPVAATDETGWAAWVETEGNQSKLTVKDASTGNEITSAIVDAGTRAVAVDGDTVYFVDTEGGHALVPGGTPAVHPVSPVSPGLILDVRSRTRAFQVDDDTIQVVQSYFSVEFKLPGKGAHLSPDGNVVATRLPGTDGEVAVYDTRSGEQFQNGLTEDDDALDFAPGDRGTIAYIVAPDGLTPGHELQLRTCDLETTLCAIAARIPNLGATPVLAR
jgi:hypothetical protein